MTDLGENVSVLKSVGTINYDLGTVNLIDFAPDDADKRDYNVVFNKAQEKIGFKVEVGVTQGIKEIY